MVNAFNTKPFNACDREQKFRDIVNAFEEPLGVYWSYDEDTKKVFIDADSMRDELNRTIEIMEEKAKEFNNES